MISLIFRTIRTFVDGGWDNGEEWFTYLFNSARLLGVEPLDLQELAISNRNDDRAKMLLWRMQHGQS
jgi:hypothetical protein